ncbi:MAG: tetratricopeptide repeat protein [Bacteroidetes bacterium]|nr:tetratricopeptide repeat protein [Bacteroidota bacterium]
MKRMQTVSQPILLSCFIIALLFACTSSTDNNAAIPVTTESEEARRLFARARDAYDVGRIDDARLLLDQAIGLDSTFALAYFYRARTATTTSSWKTFADQAEQHAKSASEGERLLISMMIAEMEGAVPERRMLARRLVDRYPRSPRALYEYAIVLDADKRTYEARSTLEEALYLNGFFAPALRGLASSYLFNEPRSLHEALRYAQHYVTLYPSEAEAHIVLGDVYRADQQLENARGEYTRAMLLDRTSYLAYVKRGHALTFIGLYNDARKDFELAVDYGRGPAKALSANYRTFTWLYEGNVTEALHENEALLHSLPLLGYDAEVDFQIFADIWFNRVLMALEARQFDVAEKAHEAYTRYARAVAEEIGTASNTSITESEIALLAGRIALQRGNLQEAHGHTVRSIDFLRNVRDARKREPTELLLGRIALAKQRYVSALEHLDEAVPDLIQVTYYRALALDGLDRKEEAQELYYEVANWNFNNIEYALIRNKAFNALR